MEEEDLPPGVDDARPAPFGAPAAWISGLDSDGEDAVAYIVPRVSASLFALPRCAL